MKLKMARGELKGPNQKRHGGPVRGAGRSTAHDASSRRDRLPPPTIHTATALDAWRIARRTSEAYQRRMHRAWSLHRYGEWLQCKLARDVADRIALRIRYGNRR